MIIKNCIICEKPITFYSQSDLSRRYKTKQCRICYIKNFPKGSSSYHWKGGKTVTDSGYIMVRQPDHPHVNGMGYVREHRLVMEKHLDRFLKPHEVVHHKNGIKTDNRITNLEITSSSKHTKLHHTTGHPPCKICRKSSIARLLCKKHYWTHFLKAHRASKL